MNKEAIAIIPARGGSKRVPNKNKRKLLGTPLIKYTIDSCKNSKYISQIYVTSDDDEILHIAKCEDCKIIKRDKKLASDNAKTIDVIFDVFSKISKFNIYPDYCALLQPTVPFRPKGLIDQALKKHFTDKFDSVISHTKLDMCHPNRLKVAEKEYLQPYDNPEIEGISRSELPEILCRDGSIYTFNTRIFMKNLSFLGKRQGFVISDPSVHVNIDTEKDWLLAEALANYFKKNLIDNQNL